MATPVKQRRINENETVAQRTKKVRILVVVGQKDGYHVEQNICHINLTREGTLNFIFSVPTEIPLESAACVFNNDLYIVGVGSKRNELWKWSAERDEWTRLANLPSDRSRHCATCVDGRIYVLGGWSNKDRETLDSVICYDIDSNKWIPVSARLCHAVQRSACVTCKDVIYLFGGDDEDDEGVNHVQVYDTSTGKVTLSSNPMPAAQSSMRAVLLGSKALLIGQNTCFIYDFELDSWEERVRFKTDLVDFGLTLNDGTLYISGGGSASADENDQKFWKCSDEVKSLSVDDFISDNQQAEWKHHNKLPRPALVQAFNEYGIERDESQSPAVDVRYVDVKLIGRLSGLTVVDDRLYVVASDDPVVNVYDAHSLKSLKAILILDMKYPQDLAGCSHNKVLYISDEQLNCIRRVNIADGRPSQWRIRENYKPYRLSVTSEHNVLVTIKNEPCCTIVEYTSEGQELREIKINRDVESIFQTHVIELNKDQLVLCDSSLDDLYVINSKGEVINSSRNYNRRHKGPKIYPDSITIDKSRGLVFAADEDRNRVEMFKIDMTHVGQVQTLREHPDSGSRVYFDSTMDRLFICSATRRQEGHRQGEVRGLTVVDDQLFVVHVEHESQVNVYDSCCMKDLEPINVPDMKNPQDLAGCSNNKFLYISDEKLRCIHRFNITDGRLSQWRVRENYRPCSMSLTSQHNLLVNITNLSTLDYYQTGNVDSLLDMVGLFSRERFPDRKVMEYTSEGQELREIKLDTSIEMLRQTIELNSDQLLFCYSPSMHRQLCVTNSEGQIIRSSSLFDQFGTPCSITADREKEIVFVAYRNNRVEMFRIDMTYVGQVETPEKLPEPSRIYADSSSNRLFVAQRNGIVRILPVKLMEVKCNDIATNVAYK